MAAGLTMPEAINVAGALVAGVVVVVLSAAGILAGLVLEWRRRVVSRDDALSGWIVPEADTSAALAAADLAALGERVDQLLQVRDEAAAASRDLEHGRAVVYLSTPGACGESWLRHRFERLAPPPDRAGDWQAPAYQRDALAALESAITRGAPVKVTIRRPPRPIAPARPGVTIITRRR